MGNVRFWTESYDPGIADLDPAQFECSLPETFREAFEHYAKEPALAFLGVHVTYAELHRYANRFANMLVSLGIEKGSVVGINLPNIPEYVIAWQGALRAGCAVTGVSPLLSAEEMEFQLKDSRARVLVTLDALFEKHLTPIASRLGDLRAVAVTSVGGFLPPLKRFLGRLLKKIPSGKVGPLPGKTVLQFKDVLAPGRYPDTAPAVSITPDDIAYLQYTGGTTGTPKGAMLTHRNAVADLLILNHWNQLEPGGRVGLSGFPFFHIAGIFTCGNFLRLGWNQVLLPNPRDTDHVCREIAKFKPYFLANVPSFYMNLAENPRFRDLDFSAVGYVLSAAAPFPREAQREFEAVMGEGKLIEVYGMTETSPLTICNPAKGLKKKGSIGLPLPNVEFRLQDPETGRDAGIGQPGEICLKGPMVMKGYYGKPEETAQVFDDDGWFHTGDVGVQDDDGYVSIVDRIKDMLIVGGFKVFSKKVEETLSRHPAVANAAIVGVVNPERPGSEIVKAFIALKPNFRTGEPEDVMKKEITDWARERLTPYETPKVIEFRDELPLTLVGKVDKKALRKAV